MLEQLLSLGSNFVIDRVVREIKGKLSGLTHALLGTIAFDMLTGPVSMDESFGANFAEHALIEGKPILQWVGDNLSEVTWQLVFHAGFCTPSVELLKLRAAIAAHQPLPLVLMNGAHQGWFVPASVAVTTRMTRDDGTLLWLEARLTLRESAAQAMSSDGTASQSPIAALTSALTGGADGITSALSQMVSKVPVARLASALPTRLGL